jgi:hypothetical protein
MSSRRLGAGSLDFAEASSLLCPPPGDISLETALPAFRQDAENISQLLSKQGIPFGISGDWKSNNIVLAITKPVATTLYKVSMQFPRLERE